LRLTLLAAALLAAIAAPALAAPALALTVQEPKTRDLPAQYGPPQPLRLAKTACDKLWDSFLLADATIREETGKPAFTPLYTAATDAAEKIGQEMLAEGCPLTDRAQFAQGIASLHRFNQFVNNE
jgi:hypothetical protein